MVSAGSCCTQGEGYENPEVRKVDQNSRTKFKTQQELGLDRGRCQCCVSVPVLSTLDMHRVQLWLLRGVFEHPVSFQWSDRLGGTAGKNQQEF